MTFACPSSTRTAGRCTFSHTGRRGFSLNTENIDRLIGTLKALQMPDTKSDIGFNMAMFYSPVGIKTRTGTLQDMSGKNCKHIACLAGWCFILRFGIVPSKHLCPTYILDSAAVFLGLTNTQSWALLYQNDASTTVKNAVEVLEELKTTRRVRQRFNRSLNTYLNASGRSQ